MYNCYEVPDNAKYVLSLWDGDCYIYTVCENEQEYEKEKLKRKRIDEEVKEKMKQHIDYLEKQEKESNNNAGL